MFREITVRLTYFLLVLAASVTGCKARKNASEEKGYGVDKDARWARPEIPVCWENGNSAAAEKWKDEMRSYVTDEFQRAGVMFVGWGDCKQDSVGIRIEVYGESDIHYKSKQNFNGGATADVKIDGRYGYTRESQGDEDGHPRSEGIGRVDGVVPANVVLTMNPTNKVANGLREQARLMNDSQKENLLKSVIVHELGHRVGLYHEQARPDSECRDQGDSRQDIPGAIRLGAYDPKSIMNYCVTHKSTYDEPLHLSDGDIAALRTLFNKH